jgi:hypothetical protein
VNVCDSSIFMFSICKLLFITNYCTLLTQPPTCFGCYPAIIWELIIVDNMQLIASHRKVIIHMLQYKLQYMYNIYKFVIWDLRDSN